MYININIHIYLGSETNGNLTTKSFPPSFLLSSTPEKRCYTYNENIVLSTPDISISEISDESKKNSPINQGSVFGKHSDRLKNCCIFVKIIKYLVIKVKLYDLHLMIY